MAKRKLKKNVRVKSLKGTQNPRVRAELLDYDYLKNLSKDDYLWLAQFTDEYVHASIEKTSKGVPKSGHIHNKPEYIKKAYDANNKRNNDVYTVNRAVGLIFDISEQNDGWYITNGTYTEDHLIAQLDNREDLEKLDILEYFEARDQFSEERQKELDTEFINEGKVTQDQFYILLIIFNAKLCSRNKIVNMYNDTKQLEKFVKNSELFKS